MEFRFAPEGEAFRQELRSFLKTELPEGWTGPLDEDDEDWEFTLEMRKKLAEKGWLAMAWPEEYGGIGASHMMLVIFAEEMAYHCAPGRDAFGTRMLGACAVPDGGSPAVHETLPSIRALHRRRVAAAAAIGSSGHLRLPGAGRIEMACVASRRSWHESADIRTKAHGTNEMARCRFFSYGQDSSVHRTSQLHGLRGHRAVSSLPILIPGTNRSM